MPSRLLLWLCLSVVSCGESADFSDADSASLDTSPGERPVILCMGDSLTAGYRLDPSDAYPALIQTRIEERGWEFEVINAGVSGETTAAGLRRLSWLLKNPVAVMILELGANDGLRGVPVETVKANLQQIIDEARDRDPDMRIILAGMQAPPNMGLAYCAAFRDLFDELEDENDLERIPFFLEGVAAVRSLNLSDGIHPNEDGHRKVADTVWEVLEPVLEDLVE